MSSTPPVSQGKSQLTCNPPVVSSANPAVPFLTQVSSADLGFGAFVPIYTQLVDDDNELIVVAQNVPAVLIFNVSDGTTSSVGLVNSATPLAASASTDGSQVFVAACDQYDQTVNPPVCSVGSIHVVSTVGGGDSLQVPYVNNGNRNMCNNVGNPAPQCLPNMVAIKPQ